MELSRLSKNQLIDIRANYVKQGFKPSRGTQNSTLINDINTFRRYNNITTAPNDILSTAGQNIKKDIIDDLTKVYYATVTLRVIKDMALKKDTDKELALKTIKNIQLTTPQPARKVYRNGNIETKVYNVKGTKAQIDQYIRLLETAEGGMDYVVGASGKAGKYVSSSGGGGSGLIRASESCILQTIDVGSGLLSITPKASDGLCGPAAIAEVLQGVRSHMDFGVNKNINRHTPEVTVDRIIRFIEQLRKNKEGYITTFEKYKKNGPKCIYSNNVPKDAPKTDITEGATIYEIQYIAELCNCKYFIALDSRNQVIIDWRHPSMGNNNIRLNNGIMCVINSNHCTYINIALKPSQHLSDIIPSKSISKDWANAKIVLSVDTLDLNTICAPQTERVIYYVKKPIHDLAYALCGEKKIPTILNFNSNDKTVTEFSYGLVLVKYTPEYDMAIARIKQLNEEYPKWNITYNGQSLMSLTLLEFENLYQKSYLSPAVFELMKSLKNVYEDSDKIPFPFAHTCIFKDWDESKVDEYIPIDVEKCYAYCMSTASFGQFSFNDDPVPYIPNTLIDCGFYRITREVGWPTHGAYSYISGAEARVYIEDGLINESDIDIQIVPSTILKKNIYEPFVKKIFEYYGKGGINQLVGLFSSSAKKQYKDTFWCDSSEELQFYMDLYDAKLNIDPIEILGKTLYRLTLNQDPLPVYSSYLPIHIMIYRANNLYMYQSSKKIGGQLMGVFTDCLIVHNPGDIVNTLIRKEDKKDNVFGRLLIEDHIPVSRRQYQPRIFNPTLKKYIWNEIIGHAALPTDFTETELKTFIDQSIPIRESIFERIINGESFMLDCDAGCGKSFFLKHLIKYLREKSIEPIITAATGNAAIKLDKEAKTTHSALGLRGNEDKEKDADGADILMIDLFNSHTRVFIIDEAFFLDQTALNKIMNKKIKYPNTSIIFCGSSIQLNCDTMMAPTSSFLNKLCNGNRINLTVNWRFIRDKSLGEFCGAWVKYLKNEAEMPDYKLFNIPNKKCNLSITATKHKADELNNIWSKIEGFGKKVIEKSYFDVFVGMPLIMNIKNKTVNLTLNTGQHFIIKEITDTGLILYYSNENRIIDYNLDPIYLKDSLVKNKLSRAYAYTVHKAQGANFTIPYSVFEYDKAFTYGHKWKTWHYVACSRSDYLHNLNIVRDAPCAHLDD